LNDTDEALQKMINTSTPSSNHHSNNRVNVERFSVDSLLKLHTTCMRSCHITPGRYLNIGVTRGVTKVNVFMEGLGGSAVEFCPYQYVEQELRLFVQLTREYMKKYADYPIALAAWMHMVFVTCHPFEKGNGRLTRILASAPLLRAGLPPICVSNERRETYFIICNETRLSNDYGELIKFLKSCMEEALSKVEE